MVEMGTIEIEALPALELQSRGVAGDGEGEGRWVGRVVRQHVRRRWVQGDLIGKRGQGGQHPRSVDDYSGVGLFDHRQSDIGPVFQGSRARRPVAL